VLRVISRIFGIYDDISQQKTVQQITQLCDKLMEKENPGAFNQALMELGAIQCTPKNPKCETCPFADSCVALEKEQVHLLPLKSSKIKIKERYFHYFIFLKDSKTIIEQRTENDIWKNLFQFPMVETSTACEVLNLCSLCDSLCPLWLKKVLRQPQRGNFLKEVKHKLTHQHLTIRFYVVNNYLPELQNNWVLVSVEDLEKYPFPVVLKDLGGFP
jgi:A/G-specific adenine glycosylase